MNKKAILRLLRSYKENSNYKDNILTIGLFGSYARNGASDLSDIDVFVTLKTPKMFDLIGIKQDLEELTDCNVDIVLLRPLMNQFLKEKISHEGLYV
ncbi:MAG: nucleotidyltransferase domain-containing protein [Candidatus Celaenobacter polaris]|nr:nucleotidyltransferase domain-containing protein [Candidatus Celaenobacter polaris]